jgi:hypothetical protein
MVRSMNLAPRKPRIPDLSKEETSPTTVRQAGAAQRGLFSQSRFFSFPYPRGSPQLLADLFSWRPRVFRIFSQFFSGRRGGGARGARV